MLRESDVRFQVVMKEPILGALILGEVAVSAI